METPRDAAAQTTWNDARTRSLVELATRRRAEQLADTALVDYKAEARGYVTFLAQVGEGFPEPPRIVKADQLALTVYWHAPNLSKQIIQGRRDTLLLPTDIAYHRDHLGIVQNNFPDIIRLGDGDEVRDVPHPLSVQGLTQYDYLIADSLRIAFPGRTVYVYEVKVRPKNDRLPRVIGAVYIDPDGGQVVRMAFSFTYAAFLDKQLEDLSIVLENGLVGTRFWLPRRQEIEIRRTGTWMDYPVRGIIRGRWEISNYEINVGLPITLFSGTEIAQVPREQQRRYKWGGAILDSLPPDVRAVTDADVQRVQNEARALVRAAALQRAQTISLSARGLSEFARFDRVEGLALGGGLTQRLGAGLSVTGRGRYGIDDRVGKWGATLTWQPRPAFSVRAFGGRELRDIGLEPERSPIVNSLAAQEFGSDYTDPYELRYAGVGLDLSTHLGLAWHLDVSGGDASSLSVNATPASGRFEPTIPVDQRRSVRALLRAEHPTSLWRWGTEVRLALTGEVAGYLAPTCDAGAPVSPAKPCESTNVQQLTLIAGVERPFSRNRLVLHTAAGIVGGSGAIPAQEAILLGGPVTAPGFAFHQFTARGAFSQRIEWQVPFGFPSLSLGRFGQTPAEAKLAPYVNAALVRSLAAADVTPRLGTASGASTNLFPSVGVGLLTFFDLLRFDVARGLRDGRWSFSVDVTRDIWGVL